MPLYFQDYTGPKLKAEGYEANNFSTYQPKRQIQRKKKQSLLEVTSKSQYSSALCGHVLEYFSSQRNKSYFRYPTLRQLIECLNLFPYCFSGNTKDYKWEGMRWV